MKQRYDFGYFLSEGFRSIFTHGFMSFAAVCMIVCCLLIMGSFTLVAVNVDHMLGDLERENEFTAFVDERYTQEQTQALQATLEAIPNVASATFVSKEEAQENFAADKADNELFASLPATVYRDRYRIHVDEIQRMEDTVAQVEGTAGIAKVRAELEIAEGFVVVRNIAGAVAVILVVILLLVSLFIISNTIKLATFNRMEEIAIMKMCGATNWFVRAPFLVEGVILGLAGGIIAFFCQWGIYGLITRAMMESGIFSIITTVPFGNISHVVLLVFLLVGFAIGGGGSVMAIRKFLKV